MRPLLERQYLSLRFPEPCAQQQVINHQPRQTNGCSCHRVCYIIAMLIPLVCALFSPSFPVKLFSWTSHCRPTPPALPQMWSDRPSASPGRADEHWIPIFEWVQGADQAEGLSRCVFVRALLPGLLGPYIAGTEYAESAVSRSLPRSFAGVFDPTNDSTNGEPLHSLFAMLTSLRTHLLTHACPCSQAPIWLSARGPVSSISTSIRPAAAV